MRSLPRRRRVRQQLASLFGALVVLLTVPALAQGPDADAAPLAQAQKAAVAAGGYTFTADVEQTLIPHATAANIGRTGSRMDVRLEGEVTLPDRARMTLRFEGAGAEDAAVELVKDATGTYMLQDGRRLAVDDPTATAGPTADYLSYLHAAENVAPCDTPSQTTPGGACYTYDISGERFAEHVRQEMAAAIRRGEALQLPPGVELTASPVLARMSGRGELWVDAAGLPVRQIVDLDIPNAGEMQDAHARVIVDFDFATTASGTRSSVAIEPWLSTVLRDVAADLTAGLTPLTGAFITLSLCGALLLVRCRHRLYRLVAALLIVIFILSPLLQALGVRSFQARQARAADETTFGAPAGDADLLLDNETHAPRAVSATEARSALDVDPATGVMAPSPARLAAGEPPAGAYCGKGDVNEDTDGDGINDAAEYCLGTDPFYGDSDRDRRGTS